MVRTAGWIVWFALAAVPGVLGAQQQAPSRAYDPPPKDYRSPYDGPQTTPRKNGGESGREGRGSDDDWGYDWSDPQYELELAINDDAVWVAFQTPLARGQGHLQIGAFATEDEEYVATAKLMRYGTPTADQALRLGVGLGAYVAWLDDPDDENIYAITLSGSARYAFATDVPTFLSFDGSFAPDVTTFDDGDRVIDALARFEVEVSRYATAFLGYRFLEVRLDDGDTERELDDQFQVGVRLGF